MTGIFDYIKNMLPYMAIAALPIILFRIIRFRQLKKAGRGDSLGREILMCTFLIFCVGLISQTVLRSLSAEIFPVQFRGTLNFQPFRVFGDLIRSLQIGSYKFLFSVFLGNIFMFCPLGFFPPLLWKSCGFLKTILFGFLFSLSAELIQLFLPRDSDIDDIWMNCLGVAVGYGLAVLVKWLMKKYGSRRV